MKKLSFPLLLLSIALLLPGCWGSKKATKKKMAHVSGSGVPLARYKKGDKRFWDDKVEAFVLEGDDQEGSSRRSKRSKNKSEKQWSVDMAANEFEPVLFDFDRYEIRKDQEAFVAYDTEQAKDRVNAGKLVRVEGHSDKQCISETYNMAVSQKRAETVAARLEKSGIGRDSIKALGYGDSKPAVDVPGKEQRNRRVEISTLA